MFISSFLGLFVDGFDLQMLSLTLPSLKAEWGLTNTQAGLLGTASLAGMGFGGVAGGWLADRYGRVRMAALMIILFSIGSFVLGFTEAPWQFMAVRFITGLGLGAEYTICMMLMAEYTNADRRGITMGALMASYSLGYLSAALLSGVIIPNHGWRWMYWIAILPVLLALYIRRVIPEPAGWRERQESSRKGSTTPRERNQWRQLWSNRLTRKLFFLWTAVAIFLQFGYYGVNTWLPSYVAGDLGVEFSSMTLYVAGTYTAGLVSRLLGGWLADRLGRRLVFSIGSFVTAALLPIIYLYQNPQNIIAFLLILGFMYGWPYAVNGAYMNESFPTELRGTATGAAYNIGRIGALLAPLIIGVIADSFSVGLGLAALGIGYVVAGLITFFFIRDKLFDPSQANTDEIQQQRALNAGTRPRLRRSHVSGPHTD
ncbi:MFS transporter [Leucobacter aridicollis]|uniref:MFS transporter n=1 Tax=Leucobacter aridicollis TaxID=283878 RepID=UPI0021051A86|nr:MFS transporter [Leucobacter aridicollis]UTX51819.1 MFS transporter [Leucobacter aridicollis]